MFLFLKLLSISIVFVGALAHNSRQKLQHHALWPPLVLFCCLALVWLIGSASAGFIFCIGPLLFAPLSFLSHTHIILAQCVQGASTFPNEGAW